MKDINELGIDEQLSRGTTRRTVVTTGAKLAYAAPLVAASLKLTAGGALAACGGVTPFSLTGVDGDLLCCGCCSQAGATRAQRGVTAQQATRPISSPARPYWPVRASSALYPARPARMCSVSASPRMPTPPSARRRSTRGPIGEESGGVTKERKIAMTSEFEMSEQLQSRPTRRVVVATGAKLAYTVPIVAASLKVSGVSAQAVGPRGGICVHSSGTNGGCMPACTSVGSHWQPVQ